MLNVAMLRGYEEAVLFVSKIADPRQAAFVKLGLTTVYLRRQMDPAVVPTSEFDLRFYAEALYAMSQRADVIKTVFEGDVDGLW